MKVITDQELLDNNIYSNAKSKIYKLSEQIAYYNATLGKYA